MRRINEEECTGRMVWVEKNVSGDLRQASEREGVQGGSETSNVVQVGHGALTKRQEAEMEVAELKML